MFRGINAVNLDTKGRMAMPTRYRPGLQQLSGGQLVITIDTQATCLLLYPLPEWEIIETKLQTLPSFNQAARRIQRLLIGHATEVEMDSHGRILLPPLLRDYAGLCKKLMLVGQGKKFELWQEEQWQMGRDKWIAEQQSDDDDQLPPEMQSLSL